MNTFPPDFFNRRQFLAHSGMGIGGVALAWLLAQEKLLAGPAPNMPRGPQIL